VERSGVKWSKVERSGVKVERSGVKRLGAKKVGKHVGRNVVERSSVFCKVPWNRKEEGKEKKKGKWKIEVAGSNPGHDRN
jgi:hypothetical protein